MRIHPEIFFRRYVGAKCELDIDCLILLNKSWNWGLKDETLDSALNKWSDGG